MTPLKNSVPLFLLPLLFTASVAQASPITVDEIDALNQSGVTLRNGQAVLTFPTTKITDSIPSLTSSGTLQNKTFDGSSTVALEKKVQWSVAGYTGVKGVFTPIFTVPAKAILTNVRYDIVTKPTTASGTASIQLNTNASADTLAATTLTNIPVSGALQGQIAGASVANYVKAAAGGTSVYFQINGNDLNAGTIDFFFSYLQSD